MITYIYWLHLSKHTDITREGYIGISNNPKIRLYGHKHKAKNGKGYHLGCAINKYGEDIELTILVKTTRKFALLLENRLRPDKCIGWNTVEGGGDAPDCTGNTHSHKTKTKISLSNLGKNLGKVNPRKGMKNSEEHTTKMVNTRMAKGNYSHKDITKKKISNTLLKNPPRKTTCYIQIENKPVRKFDNIRVGADCMQLNYSTVRDRLTKNKNHYINGFRVSYIGWE